MQRHLAGLYVVFVLLVLGGVAIDPGHLVEPMTSDLWRYTMRTVVMGGWLYVGYLTGARSRLIRGSMVLLGGVYVAVGSLSLFDSMAFGLNPSPLTGIALWLHVIYGVAALAVAARPRSGHLRAASPV
jgi:hypothetical protein